MHDEISIPHPTIHQHFVFTLCCLLLSAMNRPDHCTRVQWDQYLHWHKCKPSINNQLDIPKHPLKHNETTHGNPSCQVKTSWVFCRDQHRADSLPEPCWLLLTSSSLHMLLKSWKWVASESWHQIDASVLGNRPGDGHGKIALYQTLGDEGRRSNCYREQP